MPPRPRGMMWSCSSQARLSQRVPSGLCQVQRSPSRSSTARRTAFGRRREWRSGCAVSTGGAPDEVSTACGKFGLTGVRLCRSLVSGPVAASAPRPLVCTSDLAFASELVCTSDLAFASELVCTSGLMCTPELACASGLAGASGLACASELAFASELACTSGLACTSELACTSGLACTSELEPRWRWVVVVARMPFAAASASVVCSSGCSAPAVLGAERLPNRRFSVVSISRSMARSSNGARSPLGTAWRRRSRASSSFRLSSLSAVNTTLYRAGDSGWMVEQARAARTRGDGALDGEETGDGDGAG